MGKRCFTATAGPGNTIMQDAMSMAEMMRIPFVCAIMQRGGPSTATVIYAQQETTLTCFGGNGEGFRVVYSTSCHQDLYDYMIKSFNVAWKYKLPTFLMADGYQAKMREPVVMYDPASRGITMEATPAILRAPGVIGVDRKANHIRNTFNLEEELNETLNAYKEEYERISPEIEEYEEYKADDAEILIIAHGIVARSAMTAIDELRQKGVKAGLFRPITVRPIAAGPMRAACKRAKQILFTESADGQFARMALEKLYGLTTPYSTLFKMGLGVTGNDIVEKVEEMVKTPATV
jgi:2-oxoglutarate ferredoxin oxidoreductase subunit alpha